jgi:hypothetical protein
MYMKEKETSTSTNVLINYTNFNKSITCNVSDIVNKYISVIIEYTNLISDKPSIKNKKYYRYIYMRGLDTITHVFSMILFYTKNIDITYYHTQKSFYFYVEFIEQIIDIQHTFLNLHSRDASIFVYKKTIYEIQSEYKKLIESKDETSNANEDNDRHKLEVINKHISIYKMLFQLFNIEQIKEINSIFTINTNKMLDEIYLIIDKMMDSPSSNDFNDLYSFLKNI